MLISDILAFDKSCSVKRVPLAPEKRQCINEHVCCQKVCRPGGCQEDSWLSCNSSKKLLGFGSRPWERGGVGMRGVHEEVVRQESSRREAGKRPVRRILRRCQGARRWSEGRVLESQRRRSRVEDKQECLLVAVGEPGRSIGGGTRPKQSGNEQLSRRDREC